MNPELEILIKIREELSALNKAREGLAGARTQAAGLNKELDKSTELSRKLSGTFGQFTAANLAANAITYLTRSLAGAVSGMFALGQETANQSRNLGLSVQGYQVLRKTIQDTGGSLEALRTALTTQNRTLVEARAGVGPAAQAYRELGLSIDELAGMGRERQLEAIARAIARASDKQAAWGAASKLIGTDSVPQLRGALDALATQGYDKLTASMIRNGQIMSDVTVQRLNSAKQAYTDLFQWITVQSAELGSAIFGNTNFMRILTRDGGAHGAIPRPSILGGFGGEAAMWFAQRFNPEIAAGLNAPPPGPAPDTGDAARAVAFRQANLASESARISRELIEQDPLRTETSRRDALIPALEREIAARLKLVEAMRAQKLGTAESAEDRQMQLEAANAEITRLNRQLWAIKMPENAHSRTAQAFAGINDPTQNADYLANGREAIEAGMMNFMVKLGSTGQQTAALLESTLGATLNSIGADIWEAMKGTQAWSQMFRNLGDIAGRMLTQMIAQMIVLKGLNMMLGLFGFGITGNTGPTISRVAAAGGGTFLTHGPTSFTVGDNPGGVEMVQVTPISGLGQTTINGRGLAMAGGGTALVNGSSMGTPAPITVHQVIQVSTGVQDTVRAELMGMLPQLKAASVDAVHEAQARGRLHI